MMWRETFALLLALAVASAGRLLPEPFADSLIHVAGRSPAQHEATRYLSNEVSVNEASATKQQTTGYLSNDVAVDEASATEQELAPEVVLPGLGSVVGIMERSDHGKRLIYSYRGIPFAEAPIGERRFVAPVPRLPWDSRLDATKPGPICVQTGEDAQQTNGLIQSEDCLVLNVHVPKINPSASRLPVLVFVHGGSFLRGHANLITPYGLLDDDVILVSPQYRLGVLGFLNLQVDEVPGNAALQDVVLALRWVRDHIERFGGDPNRVTLGGHSAGGAMASLLYLSPLTRGLVHAGMSMSASALGLWALDRRPEAAASAIAALACGEAAAVGPATLVQCLRTKPTAELSAAFSAVSYQSIASGGLGMGGAAPSVQRAPHTQKVLPLEPADAMAAADFVPLPYLTGTVKHEGTFSVKVTEAFLAINNLTGNSTFVRNDLIHAVLRLFGLDDPAGLVADSAVLAYLDPQTLGDYHAMRDGVIDMLGAFNFKSPARRIVQRNADLGQPAFLYAFNHNGRLTAGSPEGIFHGAEQVYLFPGSFPGFELTGDDLNVAITLRKLVANFAIHHNPTPSAVPVSDAAVTWPPFERDSPRYLDLVWPPAGRRWDGAELTVARRERFGEGGGSDSTAGGAGHHLPHLPLAAALQGSLALLAYLGRRAL